MTPQITSLSNDIPCVILSGGRSSRFGANKALARVGGQRLIDRLIFRLEKQTRGPIAINAPSRNGYALNEREFVADKLIGGIGPLSGLHAALSWAQNIGAPCVITTPVDTPNIPQNYIERLAKSGPPSITLHNGRMHPLHGIWPVVLKDKLEAAIERGVRAAHAWVTEIEATACVFEYTDGTDPFFNVNTASDLFKVAPSWTHTNSASMSKENVKTTTPVKL